LSAVTPAATDAPSPLLLQRERDRISAVRMELLEHHPFWGHLLLSAELVAAPELPAIAATDCTQRIWYNPTRTSALSHRELGFVMAHEIGHMAYQSHARVRGRHARLWNCATDFAINRIVAQIHDPSRPGERLYAPPAGVLLDRRFDGMHAEVIYAYLEREAKLRQIARSALDQAEAEDLDSEGDHNGGIDVHVSAQPDAQQTEKRAERLKDAVNHWRRQGRRGDMPGDIERSFAPRSPPTPAWLRTLRALLEQTTLRDELDPLRLSRRWCAHDLIRPGLGGDRLPSLVVALDTSGSMTPDVIRQACAEIKAVTELAERATVIVADAAVREVIELDDLDRWLERGHVQGGGGTNHVPVFDYIREHRLEPTLLVAFTDLRTRLPPRAPEFPVLWVTHAGHGPAPFGTVIVTDEV